MIQFEVVTIIEVRDDKITAVNTKVMGPGDAEGEIQTRIERPHVGAHCRIDKLADRPVWDIDAISGETSNFERAVKVLYSTNHGRDFDLILVN